MKMKTSFSNNKIVLYEWNQQLFFNLAQKFEAKLRNFADAGRIKCKFFYNYHPSTKYKKTNAKSEINTLLFANVL